MRRFAPGFGLALGLAVCGCREAPGRDVLAAAAARGPGGGASAGVRGSVGVGAGPSVGGGGRGSAGPSRSAGLGSVEGEAVDPTIARLPLGERLAREAQSRPVQAVRAEQLRAALEAQGVVLARSRQVLARPVGATYGEAAVSDQGLGISLCEFADAAAAEAGRQRSHQLFDELVPGRTLIAHGGSLLTLTQAADERAGREAELVAGLFGALPPAPR